MSNPLRPIAAPVSSQRRPVPVRQDSPRRLIFWPFLLGGLALTGPPYALLAHSILSGGPAFGPEIGVFVFGLLIALALPVASAGVAVLGATVEQRIAKCRGRASGAGTTFVLGLF